MRRLHGTGIFLVIAIVAAWACGDDYTEGAPEPIKDGGVTPDVEVKDSAPPLLESSVVVVNAELKLGTIEPIPRGESGTLPITVVRGSHSGKLSLAVSGLPANVSASSETLEENVTTATLTLTISDKATEGSFSIDLALLDGSEKIASASLIVQITPLRAGTLDLTFGANGFVDLDVPQTLVAFAGDGTLYVNATTGLVRWSKEGVKDATYGSFKQNSSHTFWHMTVTDNGQVYFSGYELVTGSSTPIVLRIAADGNAYDGNFGLGGRSVVRTTPGTKFGNAIAVAVLPTSIYAVVKPEDNGMGQPGPQTIARMSLIGIADDTYGTNGFRVLPGDAKADESVLIAAMGPDQYVLVAPHLTAGAPSSFFVEGSIAANNARPLGDGFTTALAYHQNGSFVARSLDGGVGLFRVSAGDGGASDAGVDTSFGGAGGVVAAGPVKAISVDKEGRPVAGTCRETATTWTRYLPDGGVDPTYRNGGSTEIKCVLAMRATDKYVYLAGTGGALNRLRMARLLR